MHDPAHNGSIYKEIISIQPVLGKKMVIFSFDLYNPEDAATYPGYDMKVPSFTQTHKSMSNNLIVLQSQVTAKISSIRLLVIQPFFRELLLFLSDLKTMQSTLAPSSDVPEPLTVTQVLILSLLSYRSTLACFGFVTLTCRGDLCTGSKQDGDSRRKEEASEVRYFHF